MKNEPDHSIKMFSPWKDVQVSADENQFSSLKNNIHVDICVIGGGIAGVSTAYFLSKRKKTVAILEADEIGAGATSDTTAHLTWVLDDRYFDLVREYGLEKTQTIANSHRKAIDTMERIIAEEHIDCNFERVDGYLFGSSSLSEKKMEKESETIRSLGFHEIHNLSCAPVDGYKTGPAIYFPKQAQFHPLKYLHGLCKCIKAKGGDIFTKTRVLGIYGEGPYRIVTDSGSTVMAESIVVATNSPINNLVTMHTKQAAYQTYVMAFQMPRYGHHYALYWDDEEPYHYVRFASMEDHDLLIVGGEDHKTGQQNNSEERFRHLKNWVYARFPKAGRVEYQWCGQVLEPIDRLAFIGHNPGSEKNIYIATGFSGNGMTYGTIAGILLDDLIEGRENAWQKIYAPNRIPFFAVREFARENLNTALQLGDWIRPGETNSTDHIAFDEGAVMRKGLHMLAVYKDKTGKCHSFSAKCTHLGCVVHWNNVAKTWDCPCHGSRFNVQGKVVNGPATKSLEKVSKKSENRSYAKGKSDEKKDDHKKTFAKSQNH